MHLSQTGTSLECVAAKVYVNSKVLGRIWDTVQDYWRFRPCLNNANLDEIPDTRAMLGLASRKRDP